MASSNSSYGDLCDYASGDTIRPASREEWLESVSAAESDGGAGVIEVDGQSVYVEGGPDRDPEDVAEAREELRRNAEGAIRCDSIGAALEYLDSEDAEELLERADMDRLSAREVLRTLTGVSV